MMMFSNKKGGESLPLFGGGGEPQPSAPPGAPSSDMERFMANLAHSEDIRQVEVAARSRWAEVLQSASDGNMSIRLSSLVAAVVLSVTAALGLISHVLMLKLTKSILESYALVLGVIMLVLESRQLSLTLLDNMRRSVYQYALFLKFVSGRGALYFVAGTLLWGSAGGLIGLVVSIGLGLLGAMFFWVGYTTAGKLQRLRDALFTEATVHSKYVEANRLVSGHLSLDEFREFIRLVDVPMSRREVEAAFLYVDRDDVGFVTYSNLVAWWKEWEQPQPTSTTQQQQVGTMIRRPLMV